MYVCVGHACSVYERLTGQSACQLPGTNGCLLPSEEFGPMNCRDFIGVRPLGPLEDCMHTPDLRQRRAATRCHPTERLAKIKYNAFYISRLADTGMFAFARRLIGDVSCISLRLQPVPPAGKYTAWGFSHAEKKGARKLRIVDILVRTHTKIRGSMSVVSLTRQRRKLCKVGLRLGKVPHSRPCRRAHGSAFAKA